MAIRVTLECGHASMLRVRTTPEGYTHDWEVFVRGVDNADISQYIDKVVFNLHETFQKPKRIFKEPPYLVKESGYAGFEIPIDVYLKNKDEPKRIQIQYDLQLQQSGPAINNVIRHHEVFNPSEEFRKKLLKGGGVAVSHPEDSAEKGEFKMVPPMVSKPKLSGTDVKKHRMTEVRSSDEFSDLFGNIMTLPKHVSPENKRALSDKIVSSKTSVEKSERTEKPIKIKHSPHKEKKKDKSSDDRKDKKDRLLSKEKDRHKEKLKRPPSPVGKEDFSNPGAKKNSLPSPTKKHLVPPSVPPANQKPPSPRPKEKQHKKMSVDKDKEKDKVKDNFKVPIEERMFDRKKKKHKEDKNKDRKEKDKDSKDHDKIRDSSRGSEKKVVKSEKHEKTDKERNSDCKVSKDGKKSPKYPKERDKVRSEKSSRNETDKVKDSHSEREKQKHKHKRKDKKEKMDEMTDKEKQEKHKMASEKKNCYSALSSANPLSTLLAEMPERDSSDSTHSVDEDSIPPTKSFLLPPGSEPAVIPPPPVLCPDLTKPLSPRTTIVETKNDGEDRSRKEKTKSARSEERECRKRKRKVDSGPDEHVVKREKDRGRSLSPSVEPVSSSQSPISIEINSPYIVKETTPSQTEVSHNRTESEQVTPDSTNSNFIEPEGGEGALVFSEDYVSQLKELQQKIMTLQDNQELQRVVQVIAETGQYEITRKTFDFDLCALDRTTVQRLQQFFSAS